jgi:hypothetical protein
MMAFSNSRDHIKSAGVAQWLVKADGDIAYYSLNSLSDAKVAIKTLTEKDSRGRSYPYAVELALSAKLLNTDKVKMIRLLKTLASVNLHHIVTAINGQTFSSANASAMTGQWGLQWKLVSDKDIENARCIEIRADRKLSMTEWDAIRSAAPQLQPPDHNDVLYGLSELTRGGILPAGILKIEMKAMDSPTWTDELGVIRNGKFIAELQTTKDNCGRSIGYNVRLAVSAEALQTSETELTAATSIGSRENDYRITFADGTVAVLSNALGIHWEYHNDSDATNAAVLKIEGEGIIELGSWEGIWS